MVTTRKRATPGAEAPIGNEKKRQCRDQRASPAKAAPAAVPQASPIKSPPRASPAPFPKGRRGAALLAAIGVVVPQAGPLSPPKASLSPYPKARLATAGPPQQAQRRSSPRRDVLLRQTLPKNYAMLEDFFSALQLNYGMLRKRGQRCTYQTLRAAVEEHTGRRFLVSHLSQLQYLLPDVVSLEWVRLPVAPHSSRTEPHLAIALGPIPERWDHPASRPGAQQQVQQHQAGEGAYAAVGSAQGRAPPTAGGDISLMRQLLHYRLAAHLVEAYRRHLTEGAERLRGQGDATAAQQLAELLPSLPQILPGSPARGERAQQRQQQQPISHFAGGFWDAAPEVPQHPLPRRPDAATGTSPAAVSSHLPLPATPSTSKKAPPSSARTTARPPLPPGSAVKGQRRLSFGRGGLPLAPAVPEASPSTSLPFKSTKAGTPLDKLLKQIDESVGEPQGRGLGPMFEATEEGEEQWNGRIFTEEEARIWDALPEAARRLSREGIMSFDAHKAVEAASRRHEAGSSKEAQEARAVRSALGMLPKVYMRVQSIFGAAGPNVMKQQQVVARLRSSDETFSVADMEMQLRLLAEHAPEVCSLRPYASCGTPAVWWDRKADRASNGGVLQRLKGVAEARHSLGGPGTQAQPSAA